MAHVPNRRGLNDAETTELDDIMAEYTKAREDARTALLAAHAIYQQTIISTSERRDDRILRIIEAATGYGNGTQSRIGEYLNMSRSYLSIRIRRARGRARADEVAAKLTTDYLAPALKALGKDPNEMVFAVETVPTTTGAPPPGPKPLRGGAPSSTHNRRRRGD